MKLLMDVAGNGIWDDSVAQAAPFIAAWMDPIGFGLNDALAVDDLHGSIDEADMWDSHPDKPSMRSKKLDSRTSSWSRKSRYCEAG